MSPEVSAADVKALRDRTGAGMMDCKAALEEAGGDTEKAIELLRVKGQASTAKRSGRATGEGTVASYVHATGRVGVLVEVVCETDFVARTEEFREFAREVAVHIAGASPSPLYVTKDEISDDVRDAERSVLTRRARADGKPDDIIDKVVSGQLAKWESEVALLEQEHINADRYGGKAIEELRAELAARTGENVTITRFARFEVGEE
jgi:elongation factor Ts